MSELLSRRQFLAAVPAMVYAATAPLASQDVNSHKEIRYGIYTKDGFQPYSWDKIQEIMGLDRPDEESFYRRLEQRYAELTAAYNNATAKTPDFKQLFGLGRDNFFAPLSAKDVSSVETDGILDMNDITGGDAQSAKHVKDRLSSRDGIWGLGATRFADGSRVIMTGADMPIHRKDKVEHYDLDHFFVGQYSDGTKIYTAIIADKDDTSSYEQTFAPAEYRRVRELEEELGDRLHLGDVTIRMVQRKNRLKRELNRLMGTRAVKKFLRELGDATKADMVPNYVTFEHPYEILTQPATRSGITEDDLKDSSKYYYEFSGQGIFQKDIWEGIEMPGTSPLGVHATKWGNGPYRREYRLKDIPKEDAALLKAYFASVLTTVKRADEILAKV